MNKLTACYMGLLPAGMEHLSALLCLGCCLMTKHSISSRRDGWMDVMWWRKQCQHHLSMEKVKVSPLTSTCRPEYCTICVCETL